MKTVQTFTPAVPYPVTPRRHCARLPHHPATVRRPQKYIPRRIAIRGAYALLAAISIWTLLLDSSSRRDSGSTPPLDANSASASAAPFRITPLAESPFPRNGNPSARVSSVAVVPPVREIPMEGNRRFATSGVFFLRVPVQLQTAAGGKSLNAGTQVRVVCHQAGKIKVAHDGTEFFVEEWQIGSEADSTAGFARTAS